MNLTEECLGPCLEYCSKDYRWSYLFLGIILGLLTGFIMVVNKPSKNNL
jgi:hypothetical protein